MSATIKEPTPMKGSPHPVVQCLSHWLQAWNQPIQATGQAMILARALHEAGLIKDAEVQNGTVFLAGTVRPMDAADIAAMAAGKPLAPIAEMARSPQEASLNSGRVEIAA